MGKSGGEMMAGFHRPRLVYHVQHGVALMAALHVFRRFSSLKCHCVSKLAFIDASAVCPTSCAAHMPFE